MPPSGQYSSYHLQILWLHWTSKRLRKGKINRPPIFCLMHTMTSVHQMPSLCSHNLILSHILQPYPCFLCFSPTRPWALLKALRDLVTLVISLVLMTVTCTAQALQTRLLLPLLTGIPLLPGDVVSLQPGLSMERLRLPSMPACVLQSYGSSHTKGLCLQGDILSPAIWAVMKWGLLPDSLLGSTHRPRGSLLMLLCSQSCAFATGRDYVPLLCRLSVGFLTSFMPAGDACSKVFHGKEQSGLVLQSFLFLYTSS